MQCYLLLVIWNLIAIQRQLQKDANVFHLVPPEYTTMDEKTTEGNVDARYIYKEYDVSGVEAYKDRISRNIHMFTNTPDMTDENFGGNQSGEAMKYKLFGLEQRTAIKEGLFRKGLRRRYKLIGQIMSINRELNSGAIQDLTFTFTRNIPKSVKDEMDMYLQAGGQISQQSLMSLVSFIDNPQQEMERIENEEDAQLQKSDERMYNQEGIDNHIDNEE